MNRQYSYRNTKQYDTASAKAANKPHYSGSFRSLIASRRLSGMILAAAGLGTLLAVLSATAHVPEPSLAAESTESGISNAVPAPVAQSELADSPLDLDQSDPYPIVNLESISQLRDDFNSDFGRPRIILLLSPT